MNIEVITLDEEIKVIGLSYRKLGLPATIESLEGMWNTYGEKYRNRIENALVPPVDYGINAYLLTNKHEYIAGCAVTKIGNLEEIWALFIVPPGKYIKYACRNMEELFKNHDDIRKWAEINGMTIYNGFEIEVYPIGAFEGKDVEMCILFPIQAE
ncbi:MAG: GyrI-like domain-containing protein [Oscillospiraceae bacterium]|nr:GyrI-like domain-containing protein [Oscillospiraceae bacterium]